MIIESQIKLMGGSRTIGKILFNIDHIIGKGGPLSPFLDIPFNIEITEKIPDKLLKLWNLQSALFVAESNNGTLLQLSEPINLTLGLNCTNQTILSFSLNQSQITLIEKMRHQDKNKDVYFTVKFTGQVAGIYQTEHSYPDTMDKKDMLFSSEFGINSKLLFFWESRIDDVKLRIPQSIWINKVLPSLGFNRLRLIEIEVPEDGKYFGLIDAKSIVQLLDDATSDFHMGRYKESIWKCRHIREIIEQALEANKKNQLSTVIGHQMGWEASDHRAKFIENYWKAIIDITNAASHSRVFSFSVDEARTCILSIAVLLDYFAKLTNRT